MKALILGGTGFIGGHIALAALAQGWMVRALRRDPSKSGLLQGQSVEWVDGDLDAPVGLEGICRDIDVVFHAAGYYPSDSRDVSSQVAHSVQQTTNVLDLMRAGGARRLVYTSSYTTMVSPELAGDDLADERDQYPPGMLARSAYYECKIAMEQVLLNVGNKDIDTVMMNPTMVIGPGGKTEGTGSIFLALARGWGLAWLPVKLNLVDVRDVATGHVNGAVSGISGERYLLGGHNLELRQLMASVAEAAGVRGPRFRLPLGVIDLLVWLEDHIPGVSVFSNHLRALRYGPFFSNHKARQALDLHIRPLEDTILDTLESYRSRGYL